MLASEALVVAVVAEPDALVALVDAAVALLEAAVPALMMKLNLPQKYVMQICKNSIAMQYQLRAFVLNGWLFRVFITCHRQNL